MCGDGANEWLGSGTVEWGPYSGDAFLEDWKTGTDLTCQNKCNCNEVVVECRSYQLGIA